MATAVRVMRKVRSINQWSSITPLNDVPAWYMDALQTVERLTNMAENWDSYGSARISMLARTSANELLSIHSLNRTPPPHIAPVASGELQFEWVYEDRELELEILPTGDLEFLITSESGEMVEGPVSDSNRQIPILISWVLTGDTLEAESDLDREYATSP